MPKRYKAWLKPTSQSAVEHIGRLYDVNDNTEITEKQREKKVRSAFAKQGITVTFAD